METCMAADVDCGFGAEQQDEPPFNPDFNPDFNPLWQEAVRCLWARLSPPSPHTRCFG